MISSNCCSCHEFERYHPYNWLLTKLTRIGDQNCIESFVQNTHQSIVLETNTVHTVLERTNELVSWNEPSHL